MRFYLRGFVLLSFAHFLVLCLVVVFGGFGITHKAHAASSPDAQKYEDFKGLPYNIVKEITVDGIRGYILESDGNIGVGWIVNNEFFVGRRYSLSGTDISLEALKSNPPKRDDLSWIFSKLCDVPHTILPGTENKTKEPVLYIVSSKNCPACNRIKEILNNISATIPFSIGIIDIDAGLEYSFIKIDKDSPKYQV